MNIDFNSWGPLTVLTVIAGALLMAGGVAEVVLTPYTFSQFINDLRPFASALGLGTALARGIRFANHTPTTPVKAARRRTTIKTHD